MSLEPHLRQALTALLDLEARIMHALSRREHRSPIAAMGCFTAIREALRQPGDPQIQFDPEKDLYTIVRNGEVIGKVRTGLSTVEPYGRDHEQFDYIACRADGRMMRSPRRSTLDDAVAHIGRCADEGSAEPAGPVLVGDQPTRTESQGRRIGRDDLMALLAWTSAIERLHGRKPTYGEAARAFGITPDEVAAMERYHLDDEHGISQVRVDPSHPVP